MKKNILLFILPVIFLAIIGYLLSDRFLSKNVVYEPVQIFSVDPAEIVGISVNSGKPDASFELVKKDEQWFFSDNESLKVIQSKAHSLSYDLSHIFTERTVQKVGTNLQQYGLEPAVSVVTVKLSSGDMKEFYVGNRLDNGREYYFKAGDSPEVYTLYIGKGQMFTSARQDFVDKKLSYISREDISKITVYNSQKQKTVIQKEFYKDGLYAWNVIEPVKWNVLESYLESSIIYPLLSLQAKSFDETPVSDEEFKEKSAACIEIESSGGTLTSYYFSEKNEDGTCYVKKSGYYPALIDSKLCDIADFETDNILNKRIYSYRYDGWEKCIFYDNGKSISCYTSDERQGKYFINDEEVTNEAYTRYTSNLSELTCNGVIGAGAFEKLNVYVEYIYDNSSLKFEFYKYNDESYAVSCDGVTFASVDAKMFDIWKNKLLPAL